jgi:hypothetical protein
MDTELLETLQQTIAAIGAMGLLAFCIYLVRTRNRA